MSLSQERPEIRRIPSLLRLARAQKLGKDYTQLVSPQLSEVGLYPSTREGIWLVIANSVLSEYGIVMKPDQINSLMDQFVILRRIYKSADDAWDQSLEVRNFILQDPFENARKPLTWTDLEGNNCIADVGTVLNFLDYWLLHRYPRDPLRSTRITQLFNDFIDNSVMALVSFESMIENERMPLFHESYDFYRETTGGIGNLIAQLITIEIGCSSRIQEALQKSFVTASITSQMVDDCRDILFDINDPRSPNLIKILAISYGEIAWDAVPRHISYRELKGRFPNSTIVIDNLLRNLVQDLPKNLRQFLEDFYFALPPSAVSHKDKSNKSQHTNPTNHELLLKDNEKGVNKLK